MGSDRKQIVTTPPVRVEYARLRVADRKFSGPNQPGNYSIVCYLDPADPDQDRILKGVRKLWDLGAERQAAINGVTVDELPVHDYPWQDDHDQEGKPTGLVTIRPKQKEYFPGNDGERVKVRIPIVDASGAELPDSVLIGNGSVCRVQFEVRPFYSGGKYGLSFRLRGVQVRDLVRYEPGPKFGEIDGYRHEDQGPEGQEPEAGRGAGDQGAEPVTETQHVSWTEDDGLPF